MKEKVTEKVITDNSSEKLVVRWDGTRFGIVYFEKWNNVALKTFAVILNPNEAMALVKFLASCGEEE